MESTENAKHLRMGIIVKCDRIASLHSSLVQVPVRQRERKVKEHFFPFALPASLFSYR